MKQMLKKLVKKLLSTLVMFFYGIEWLAQMVLHFDFKNYIKYEETQNDFLILANGESLNEDLKRLEIIGDSVCAVNFFFKSPLFKILKPNYYVFADPHFFTNDDFFRQLKKNVDWHMTLFVPFSIWDGNNYLREMKNGYITVLPYKNLEWKSFKFLRFFLYKKGLTMPKCQNVLIPSIMVGINMGYKCVKICGADNSWSKTLVVDEKNRACTALPHFYDNKAISYKPWLDLHGNQLKLHEIFNLLSMTFASYHDVKAYADYMHCKIVNLTKGSYIDAFDKV